MTRAEASEKITKLRRLAEKAGTPAEADSAKRLTAKLIAQFSLTEVELSLGLRAAAFDDLISELDTFVRKHQVPSTVLDVMERVKRETKNEDKADALVKIVAGIRAASLFFGHDKSIRGIKNTVDTVLRTHGVTI